jgi:hypothetical protein
VVFNNQQMLQAAMICRGGLTVEEGVMMTTKEVIYVPFSGVGKGDSNNNSNGDGDSDSEGDGDGDSDSDGNGDGDGKGNCDGDCSEVEMVEWQ